MFECIYVYYFGFFPRPGTCFVSPLQVVLSTCFGSSSPYPLGSYVHGIVVVGIPFRSSLPLVSPLVHASIPEGGALGCGWSSIFIPCVATVLQVEGIRCSALVQPAV